MGWGGGGGYTRKLGLAVLQCNKFNVEGIQIRSTWKNGGGGGVCDKLRGVYTTRKGEGVAGYAIIWRVGPTWKKEIAGQRTSKSGMEVLIHHVLKVIKISAGIVYKIFVNKQNVLVKRYVPLMAQQQKKLYFKQRSQKFSSLLSHAENQYGSIPKNACVTCKTKRCVTTKKVRLTDRRTDPYVSLCACFSNHTKTGPVGRLF